MPSVQSRVPVPTSRPALSPSPSPSPSPNSSTQAIFSRAASRTSRLPVRQQSGTVSRVPILRSGKPSLVSIPPGRRTEPSVTSSPEGTWGRSSDDEEEVTTPIDIGQPQGFGLNDTGYGIRSADLRSDIDTGAENNRRSHHERTLQLLEGRFNAPKVPGTVPHARAGIPLRVAACHTPQKERSRSSPSDTIDNTTALHSRQSTKSSASESAVPADIPRTRAATEIPRTRLPASVGRKTPNTQGKFPEPRNFITKLQDLLKSKRGKRQSRIPTPATPPPRYKTTVSPPRRQTYRQPAPPRPARSPVRTPSPTQPATQATSASSVTGERATMPAARGLVEALMRVANEQCVGLHRARVLRFANMLLTSTNAARNAEIAAERAGQAAEQARLQAEMSRTGAEMMEGVSRRLLEGQGGV